MSYNTVDYFALNGQIMYSKALYNFKIEKVTKWVDILLIFTQYSIWVFSLGFCKAATKCQILGYVFEHRYIMLYIDIGNCDL